MALIPPEITTGIVYGITTSLAFLYFNLYTKSRDRQREKYEENINGEVDEVKEFIKALPCKEQFNHYAELAKSVNSIAIQLKSFISFTQEVYMKQGKTIDRITIFCDKLNDDFMDLYKAFYGQKIEKTIEPDKKINCLLVEDREDVIEAMADSIQEKFGYYVTQAKSVDQAIDLLGKKHFDCAIVDYNLGDKNANDFISSCNSSDKLIKRVNGSKPSYKILIYTGDEDAKIPIGIESIQKPINWIEFDRKIKCVLAE